MYFSSEVIPKLKKDEGLTHIDAMARVDQVWNKMKDEEKDFYEELH